MNAAPKNAKRDFSSDGRNANPRIGRGSFRVQQPPVTRDVAVPEGRHAENSCIGDDAVQTGKSPPPEASLFRVQIRGKLQGRSHIPWRARRRGWPPIPPLLSRPLGRSRSWYAKG